MFLGQRDCPPKRLAGEGEKHPYLIQLLVVGHGQQDVPGCDPSLLVVSCSIARQFQNLSCGEQRGRALVILECQGTSGVLPGPTFMALGTASGLRKQLPQGMKLKALCPATPRAESANCRCAQWNQETPPLRPLYLGYENMEVEREGTS